MLRLKCLKCNTIAETSSSHIRARAQCSCGAVDIDGGISMGSTINGNPFFMVNVSIYRTEAQPKLQLPQDVVDAYHARIRDSMLNSYRKLGYTEEQARELALSSK